MTPHTDARPGWNASKLLPLLPNGLTLLRLGLGLAFPWLPHSDRLPVFLVATVTEAADGILARRLGATSLFGQILDPIADKIFVLAVLLTLANDGPLAWWMLPFIAARDILVVGGGIWVVLRHGAQGLVRMPPTLLGKITTACQFALMLGLLVRSEYLVELPIGVPILVTATFSTIAGLDYLRRFE